MTHLPHTRASSSPDSQKQCEDRFHSHQRSVMKQLRRQHGRRVIYHHSEPYFIPLITAGSKHEEQMNENVGEL